ncbi:MAG: hypothetical protein CL843_16460 [Crocinitomicaceae bacterium]|nr:hypothetical protein [Crocinitomicaceae bacterium]|tara:strand:- start:1 stop:726 length:726 start_codon:yes stop_codon:yes gene_type:complete
MSILTDNQLLAKINNFITTNGNNEIEGAQLNELLQDFKDSKSHVSHTHTAAQVGLGNADNTSDAEKPVSTAQQAALDTKIDKFTASDIDHNAAGVLTIDLDDSEFVRVSVEADITQLIISKGMIGMAYRLKLTQANGGGHTLTLAPAYPPTGTNVTAGEKYIYTHIDNDGFIVRTRVYQVVDDYQTVDIDSDIANGDLKAVYYLPDGVTPLLSIEDEQVDMLAITITDTGEYQINLESSNM